MDHDRLVVVDSGVSTAAANIVVDRAWLDGHGHDGRDSLLRFYRSRPSVWLGAHQFAEREVRLDYCARQGLPVVRRLTGGGTVYVDEQQFGWSLIVPRDPDAGPDEFAQLHRRAAQAVSSALAGLGVGAVFKEPNDLEVAGRKLASCFATLRGGSALVHGTVLMDVDVDRALHALRVPTEKLSADGLAGARQRLTTLTELCPAVPALKQIKRALAAAFVDAFELSPRKATKSVYAALRAPHAETGDEGSRVTEAAASRSSADGPGEALFKTAAGLLRARIEVEPSEGRVRRLALAGDVFVHPADLFERIGRDATGVALSGLPTLVAERLGACDVRLQGCAARDVAEVVTLAADRLDQRRLFGFTPEQANALMVLGRQQGLSVRQILERAQVMLVPYCAKPVDCRWRSRDGCPECGKCEVGRAYQLGRIHGMRVLSINNYEHLCRTLAELREAGVQGLVGMCCQNFFIKRNQAFVDSQIPMVLMDISGSNCYELGQEEQAYAGTFAARSRLDVPVLERVMHYVPVRR